MSDSNYYADDPRAEKALQKMRDKEDERKKLYLKVLGMRKNGDTYRDIQKKLSMSTWKISWILSQEEY